MHRAFVLLLQPTVRQQAALGRLLNVQRELYNAALEERIGAWRRERRTVTRFDQQRSLTGWKQEFGVWPARGTLVRLDRAFQAFFHRMKNVCICKASGTSGSERPNGAYPVRPRRWWCAAKGNAGAHRPSRRCRSGRNPPGGDQ